MERAGRNRETESRAGFVLPVVGRVPFPGILLLHSESDFKDRKCANVRVVQLKSGIPAPRTWRMSRHCGSRQPALLFAAGVTGDCRVSGFEILQGSFFTGFCYFFSQ